MRYAATHKQQTRARVVEAAARSVRRAGPDRIGIAGIMSEAGLTHGGFYTHFESKDALLAAAIARMFEQAGERIERTTCDRAPDDALGRYIDFYLSNAHRDACDNGCPMPTLASDLPRLSPDARAAYAKGATRFVARIRALLVQLGHLDADALAHSIVAELVGALSIARATAPASGSSAFLRHSRRALKRRLNLEPVT